jgi:hypothetical protein
LRPREVSRESLNSLSEHSQLDNGGSPSRLRRGPLLWRLLRYGSGECRHSLCTLPTTALATVLFAHLVLAAQVGANDRQLLASTLFRHDVAPLFDLEEPLTASISRGW